MSVNVENNPWIDYSDGLEILQDRYCAVQYPSPRGVKVTVDIEADLKTQIAEIYRTCGKGTPIRLFLKENANA